MLKDLRDKNTKIKEIKGKLKQTNAKTSASELDAILSSLVDKKAFLILLDAFETEKEIYRDIFESLIEHSFEINECVIDYLENGIDLSKGVTDLFQFSNIKAVLLIAVSIGIVIAIVSNSELVLKIAGNSLPAPQTKDGAK